MSTIIVLAVAVVVAGWVNRDLIRLKIASVYARVTPKGAPSLPPLHGSVGELRGDAPWALSALPECLRQKLESRGTLRYVQSHLPANVVPIVPPRNLSYGDCTIEVRGRQAFVHRGSDAFRIPPNVQFFRAGDALAMLRVAGGSADLRVYEALSP